MPPPSTTAPTASAARCSPTAARRSPPWATTSTAAQAFSAATQDASYATPFKAYLGLGNALFQSGDYANAGTAFRQAAIDGANPAPAAALRRARPLLH